MAEEVDSPFAPFVVVPAFGRPDSTRRALRSLGEEGARNVILVDDEGRGHGEEMRAESPLLDVVRTERPVYWTGAIAVGVERALGRGARGVLFFNQDVTLKRGFFARLARTAQENPRAIVGCVAVYAQEPETVWSAGARMEWFGRGFRVLHHGRPLAELPAEAFPVDWTHGMGTYVPAEVFGAIGLPDAARFPMAWGDADFCLRAREAGVPVVVDPGLRLVHEVGGYDARVAGAPALREYLAWLRDDRHNLSLSGHAKFWRRHGPRGLWPVSLAIRVAFLLANYARMRLLFARRVSPA
jgi:GT2 family glycosyltransferase